MGMTASIYGWAASKLDDRDLAEIMKRHGFEVRRAGDPSDTAERRARHAGALARFRHGLVAGRHVQMQEADARAAYGEICRRYWQPDTGFAEWWADVEAGRAAHEAERAKAEAKAKANAKAARKAARAEQARAAERKVQVDKAALRAADSVRRRMKDAGETEVPPETILLRTSLSMVCRVGADNAWEWYVERCRALGRQAIARSTWDARLAVRSLAGRSDDPPVDVRPPKKGT